MQERRRFPRVTYPCTVKVTSGSNIEEFSLRTENISTGGVRIIMQTKPQINDTFNVEIVVGEKHIKTQGRVVWVLDITTPGAQGPDLFDAGVEFTQVTTEDREFLAKLIDQLMQEKRWQG